MSKWYVECCFTNSFNDIRWIISSLVIGIITSLYFKWLFFEDNSKTVQ